MYQLHYFPANANAAPHMRSKSAFLTNSLQEELMIWHRFSTLSKLISWPTAPSFSVIDLAPLISIWSCFRGGLARRPSHRVRAPTSQNFSTR
jgi:hypothetical protein